MKIDQDSPDHPYVQLANWLRAEIRARQLGPRLPSITEIAGESGLSPATVKRALGILAEEGLIRSVRGRGTFVSAR